ncbi:hypothetical protein ACFLUZ_00810 [Chloroflexota bacterium]
MVTIFVYLLLVSGFFLILAVGLALLLFPVRIIKWSERNFSDTSEWIQQSRIYKFWGIRASQIFFIWCLRIVGAGTAIVSGAALFQLIYWLFKPPS